MPIDRISIYSLMQSLSIKNPPKIIRIAIAKFHLALFYILDPVFLPIILFLEIL